LKKKLVPLFIMSFLMLSYISCSKDSPTKPEPELTFEEKLQKALDDAVISYNGKGVSAAIIMPDGETWNGVSGLSQVNNPITSDMVFSVGSITKMFTAVTIIQLAQEGVLSLQDSIGKWLPVYPNVDSTITIYQLLNHTSGIFNITENPAMWQNIFVDPNRVWTIDEILNNYTLAPNFAKGTDWHYSNTGYLLLRKIIQVGTGSEISTEYRTRFFDSLNLNSAFTAPYETPTGIIAQGWFDLDNDGTYDELPFMTSFYSMAGGGVFCTAADLALWAHSLFHDKVVLPQSNLDEMLNFHTPCPGEDLVNGYGLGVARFAPELFNGLEIWGHGGNAIGYAAGCFYLPDYDVSIAIMDNTEEGESMWVINDLLNIVTSHLD
jgi:D-alanyl-D-alanine carboxypeptidase